ncbi:MAG: hypothetical protein IID33_01125 [Planctomycetes bacterium]|nr:hypothetical protein [Planctomycetota bacterium]
MGEIQNNAGFSGWHSRVLAGVLLCIAATDAAWGQCEPVWTQRMDVPAHRRNHSMAFDSRRGVVVMFAGSGRLQDLWEWEGVEWTFRDLVGPVVRPDLVEMAFDSARGVMVMREGTNPGANTWEYDGSQFTLVSSGGPQDAVHYAMAYDAARGVTLLWGEGGVGTWSWDGAQWTFLTTGPAEGLYEMTYDSGREVVVMFGVDAAQGRTLEWDGEAWSLRTTAGPQGRAFHGLAYDERRGVTVLYGGLASPTTFDDTWEWDGVSWTHRERHARGPSSARHGLRQPAGRDDPLRRRGRQ